MNSRCRITESLNRGEAERPHHCAGSTDYDAETIADMYDDEDMCPTCGGTGDDERQPVAAAGLCSQCQGTGRRSLSEHPLYEDTGEK